MKTIIFYLVFIGSIAYASEGFFLPSQLSTSKPVNKALRSAVAFNFGSGVVIDGNKIVTASHVVSGCACPPAHGSPVVCEKEFKTPDVIDEEGKVLTWKSGKTNLKLICGLNSGVSQIELLKLTLSHFSSYPDANSLNSFFPQEEAAILQFDNSKLKIPSLSIRQNKVSNTEKLSLLGYPGASLRSRDASEIRLDAVQDSLKKLKELASLLSRANPQAIEDFGNMALAFYNDLGNRIDTADKNSVEFKALTYGSASYYGAARSLTQLWQDQILNQVCSQWRIEPISCYKRVLTDQLSQAIKSAKSSVEAIRSESAIKYPEANQTLRISFGHALNYQTTTETRFGLLQTDVDAVSGNSGGPLVDDHAELIGVASTGPWGSSLNYRKGEGVTAVSHEAIQYLLDQIRSSP